MASKTSRLGLGDRGCSSRTVVSNRALQAGPLSESLPATVHRILRSCGSPLRPSSDRILVEELPWTACGVEGSELSGRSETGFCNVQGGMIRITRKVEF